jgi:hypothetical protein
MPLFGGKIQIENLFEIKYLSNLTSGAFGRCLPESQGPPFALTCFPEFYHRQKHLAIKNLTLSYRCYMILEKKK